MIRMIKEGTFYKIYRGNKCVAETQCEAEAHRICQEIAHCDF